MLSAFLKNTRGSVSVEASFLLIIMVALPGATVEAAHAYFQWNGAQQAARHGARLAATSDPVAENLKDMTGLESGGQLGAPMPDYSRTCSGKTAKCDSGNYNSQAMNDIVFGPDHDGTCGATQRERRGMCDVFSDLSLENVEVIYQNSGLGTTGYPAKLAPLVTVKVTDMKFDFVFLNLFTPDSFSKMPDVTVSIMAEDLKSGA